MPQRVAVAKKTTFNTDDKRAMYARLIAFNFGRRERIISKDHDVNSVPNSLLDKAIGSLVGGNLLEGKDGIALIQALSEKGSTTGRPLTVAYAQEVRPFLRRRLLSPSFGRRGGGPRGPRTQKAVKAAKGGSQKKASRGGKSRSQRSAKASAPAPSEEPTGEE